MLERLGCAKVEGNCLRTQTIFRQTRKHSVKITRIVANTKQPETSSSSSSTLKRIVEVADDDEILYDVMTIDTSRLLLYGGATLLRLLLFLLFPSLPVLLGSRVEISTPITSFKRCTLFAKSICDIQL